MGCDYSLKLNYGVISLMCWGTISLKISGRPISRNKLKNKQPANAEINPQLVAKTSPMSRKIRKVGNTALQTVKHCAVGLNTRVTTNHRNT